MQQWNQWCPSAPPLPTQHLHQHEKGKGGKTAETVHDADSGTRSVPALRIPRRAHHGGPRLRHPPHLYPQRQALRQSTTLQTTATIISPAKPIQTVANRTGPNKHQHRHLIIFLLSGLFPKITQQKQLNEFKLFKHEADGEVPHASERWRRVRSRPRQSWCHFHLPLSLSQSIAKYDLALFIPRWPLLQQIPHLL